MKKTLVFPLFSLIFLLSACGVPTAEHTKAVNDLADCAKQRDETVVQ